MPRSSFPIHAEFEIALTTYCTSSFFLCFLLLVLRLLPRSFSPPQYHVHVSCSEYHSPPKSRVTIIQLEQESRHQVLRQRIVTRQEDKRLSCTTHLHPHIPRLSLPHLCLVPNRGDVFDLSQLRHKMAKKRHLLFGVVISLLLVPQTTAIATAMMRPCQSTIFRAPKNFA